MKTTKTIGRIPRRRRTQSNKALRWEIYGIPNSLITEKRGKANKRLIIQSLRELADIFEHSDMELTGGYTKTPRSIEVDLYTQTDEFYSFIYQYLGGRAV